MQTSIRPTVFIGIVLISLCAALFLVMATAAHANPSYFYGSSATATSTPMYMTAGTATSTYVLKVQSNGNSAADNAAFLLQLTGSSTASQAQVAFEYANDTVNDCAVTPTTCDWYTDTYTRNATTTQTVSLIGGTSYVLNFASTTVGGAAGTGNGRMTRIINVPTPTMYVRAVVTLPPGSTNAAVWGQFIARKQVN
jgi:hypothetical protein